MTRLRAHVSLLVIGLLLFGASSAFAEDGVCKRKTPIRRIGICMHPHGAGVNTWTYDLSGRPATGRMAEVFLACHEVLPLFVFEPNADPKNRDLLPIEYRGRACEPAPPVSLPLPPKPSPAVAKPAPPAKGMGDGKGKKGDGNGGGGRDEESVEARVAKKRLPQPKEAPREKAKPKETVLTEERLLPSESLLPTESILPRRDEVARKWVDEEAGLEDQGGALPVQHHRPGQAVWSVASCDAGKGECKRLVPTKKTTFEQVVEQVVIAGAIFNLQMGEDLARPDGKEFGIVGGMNPDGPNDPRLQALAAAAMFSPAARLLGNQFMKEASAALAKGEKVIIRDVSQLSEEAAEYLAAEFGEELTQAMAEAGIVGPYKIMAKFTAKMGGRWQAHHILEKQMFGRFKQLENLDHKLSPAVILSKTEHEAITAELKIRTGAALRMKQLWSGYVQTYATRYPHWLRAIKHYFPGVD